MEYPRIEEALEMFLHDQSHLILHPRHRSIKRIARPIAACWYLVIRKAFIIAVRSIAL
jgi:hypothetical protein